jgi:hypothetical protein
VPDDNLLDRLRRLEDEQEITRALHRYAHAIDYGDEETWVDCFTPDGTLEIERPLGDARTPLRVAGSAALHELAAGHTRAPESDFWHKHVAVEPLIEIEGDDATCTSYLFLLMDVGGVPTIRNFGRYRDALARCLDGRWRFSRRVLELEVALENLPPFVGGRPGRA